MSTQARTLGELCLDRALRLGAVEAVADGLVALSYGELAAAAGIAADRLHELGVRPGDRVALQGRNEVPWVVAAFGILLAGASVVPLGHHTPEPLRRRLLARVPVRLLVIDQDVSPEESAVSLADLVGLAAEIPSTATPSVRPAAADPDAEALVMLSSGTTGEPKAVSMSHRQILGVYTEVVGRLGLRAEDRLLGVVPLAHSFGFNGVLIVSMLAGAMVRLVPSYDRRTLAELVAGERLGVVSGPPTLLRDLAAGVDQGVEIGGIVRLVIAGSAQVSVEELDMIAARLGHPRVVVGYGMSETCGTVALSEGPLVREHAWMWPLSGTEVRLRTIDDSANFSTPAGVLMVRGHNVSSPLGGESRPDVDGWFDTGDLGILDEEGRIAVVGRADDRVTVGGFSVHPAQVERALLAHPSVESVVVVGVPDQRRGARLVACLVPTAGHDLEGVEQFLVSRLRPYELPDEYVVVDVLPTTNTGKASRRQVAGWLDEGRVSPYG